MSSQTASFDARAEDGREIARAVHAGLASRGWTTAAFDNWPVAGWSIPCRRGDRALEVTITREAAASWAMAITPAYKPGLIGVLRGKAPSADVADCYELARVAHEILAGDRRVWALCWGDDTRGDDVTWPEPPPPALPQARVVRRR